MNGFYIWILNFSWIMSTAIDYVSLERCAHPGIPCFDETVPSHVTALEGDDVQLQCYVYQANFSSILITWWREDGLRELTLGKKVYNKRYALSRRFYEDWSLTLNDIRADSDSGVYICQINLIEVREKFFRLSVRPDHRYSKEKFTDTNFVKDEAFKMKSQKTVSITGPRTVSLGDSWSVSCMVHFPDSFSDASIQWFHNDSRQVTDRQMLSAMTQAKDKRDDGSTEISLRWLRNNTAYSVLSLSNAIFSHSGLWSCVKQTGIEIRPLETAKLRLSVVSKISTERERVWRENIHLTENDDSTKGGTALGVQSQKPRGNSYPIGPYTVLLLEMLILAYLLPT